MIPVDGVEDRHRLFSLYAPAKKAGMFLLYADRTPPRIPAHPPTGDGFLYIQSKSPGSASSSE